ncbi:hypothetical protein M0R19_04730 [Candidatus Pacearchaeota archaeon]|jgi:hypothetical protein|nr:hypothetical protein [Candidatus Pacearchaeota archaeon]
MAKKSTKVPVIDKIEPEFPDDKFPPAGTSKKKKATTKKKASKKMSPKQVAAKEKFLAMIQKKKSK